MKKFLLSGFIVVTFIGYAIYQRINPASAAPEFVTPTATNTSTTTQTGSSRPGPQNRGGMGGGMMHSSGTYKNGQYTGPVVDAFYGYVQVRVTISGGQLTDVQFLQYPSDRRTSQQINSIAMPELKQEAIEAQSANVNGVSGATATSRAFIESLQSALDQAQT